MTTHHLVLDLGQVRMAGRWKVLGSKRTSTARRPLPSYCIGHTSPAVRFRGRVHAQPSGSHHNPCYRNPGACIRLLLPK